MNIAYIDGQNLYKAIREADDPWELDLYRFRTYLERKYGIDEAYYFFGFFDGGNQVVYTIIQNAGFTIKWREHGRDLLGHKKGNVDTDIVFQAMHDFIERDDIDKIFFVSGDGDYFKTVNYLLQKGKLGRILFPVRKNASSLYRKIPEANKAYLDAPDVKKKISRQK